MRTELLLLALCVVPLSALPANAAPSNDDLADAMLITSLPFWDLQDFSTATSELGEPGCGGASRTPLPSDSPTVWYRYSPDETETLVATTHRTSGSWGFTVFQQTPGGLETTACGRRPSDQSGGDEPTKDFAMFTTVAGETYLIQVTGPPSASPDPLQSFTLEVAPNIDIQLDAVHAEDAPPEQGLGAWNWWISFAPTVSDPTTGGLVAWDASSCPRASILGCSHIASGEYLLVGGNPRQVSFLYSDHGCVGDVEIRVDVRSSDARESNLTDNAASTVLEALVPDPDAGICPL